MKISIVIPNYNGEELLRKNLPKLIEAVCNYKDIEIIIVDDGSTDDSINIIQNSEFRIQNSNLKLKIIQNEKNLGFSSTVNKGAKEAKGDILVLLNTDVVPEKDFLKPLMEHFNDESVFAVGCMDKSIENGKTVLRGRGIGKWKKGFLVHKRGEINKTNTLWVGGGSGAFRKLIWDRLGGLNQIYDPFYWEDIDLSYRALKSGYKVLFEPKSIVYHEHEKGAIRKKFSPFKIKTIAYRNQFIFVWENETDFDLQISHLLWLPYHLIKALLRRDLAFFLGFFKAFILLPKIIQSSFKAQKLFIKSDREVIKEFFK